MWLKSVTYGQIIVVALLIVATSAANSIQQQLKNQQQSTLGGTTSAQPQQQQQQQHVQQQQHEQSVAHPSNGRVHATSNTGQHNNIAALHTSSLSSSSSSSGPPALSSSTTSAATDLAQLNLSPQAAYINDKDAAIQEVLKHFNTDDEILDPYQILNDFKREPHATAAQSLHHQQQQQQQQQQQEHLHHPSPPTSTAAVNFPWNLYDRQYAQQPLNNLPAPPPSPTFSPFFPHMYNPYEGLAATPYPISPRFMPFMGYPQPIYVPYPFYMSPEMFYSGFSHISGNLADYEDSMSRGASSTKRPSAPPATQPTNYARNSPIYYVRLPPTPYMFVPSLGLGTPATPLAGYSTMMPYQPLPSFSTFSPLFNLPVNFLSNGKPSNIYQMGGSPNDLQTPYPFTQSPSGFSSRPPPPPPSNSYRPPPLTSQNYFNTPTAPTSNIPSYGPFSTSPSALSSTQQSASSLPLPPLRDSKLTSLKRPYFFNGRPEDIYVLPNNFNHLYSSDSTYY